MGELVQLVNQIAAITTPEHIAAAEAGLEAFVLGRIEGGVGGVLLRACYRAVRPVLHLPQLRIDALGERMAHVEEFVDQFRMEREKRDADEAVIEENVSDPAFEDFCTEAIEIAMRSATEGKSMLLGRLAAKRAAVLTESMDDLLLRAALRITDETNLAQLNALEAVYLVAHTPLPENVGGMVAIWEELQRRYGAVIVSVGRNGGWADDDLEYLASIGALRHIERPQIGSAPQSRLEIELGPGTRHWPVPVGSIPATVFRGEVEMLDSLDRGIARNVPLLRGYVATPAGQHLAAAMLETLAAS